MVVGLHFLLLQVDLMIRVREVLVGALRLVQQE